MVAETVEQELLPAWKRSPFGKRRYWTRQRVIAALQRALGEISGPLPTSDKAWSAYKKGRMDLPPATRILEYFGGISRGFLAAGARPPRLTVSNLDWTEEEEAYLLTYAGDKTLAEIARHLGQDVEGVADCAL